MVETTWQPTATTETLKRRAKIIQNIRQFFEKKSVLEVETPILSAASGTDVQLSQCRTMCGRFLHTSPEFAMKRLLAAGCGDIFQIARVFRQDEVGARHNPEFTMLEWYRLGYDEFDLMVELLALFQRVSGQEDIPSEKITYQQAFLNVGLMDPHISQIKDIRALTAIKLNADTDAWSKDECLDALMAIIVEPSLSKETVTFVYDYPESQGALAQFSQRDGYKVARRFEAYWHGMELANGYFELTDAVEQCRRFDQEALDRVNQGLDAPTFDENFIAALKQGIPLCSGVAVGLDRLIMIVLNKQFISEVIAYPFNRA